MVVHACGPSYSGGVTRRIIVQAGPGENAIPYLKNKTKKTGAWLSGKALA
jgi:hypothetical protein